MILSKFATVGHQNRAINHFFLKRPKTACSVIKMFLIQSFQSENVYGPEKTME